MGKKDELVDDGQEPQPVEAIEPVQDPEATQEQDPDETGPVDEQGGE